MLNKSLDLLCVIVLTAAAMAVTLLDVPIPELRLAMGLALVLALPGYAVTAAALPEGAPAWEMVLFSLGSSAALAALGGIALNWTPWGLEQTSWAVYLCTISLVGSAIGLIRRWRLGIGPRLSMRRSIGLRQGLLLLLAALTAGAALVVASNGASRPSESGFTQFWMVPVDESGSDEVRLGVYNAESSDITYAVDLKQDGGVVSQWSSIPLGSGQMWETIVVVPRPQAGSSQLEATLRRLDEQGTSYRHVLLWRGNK